MSAIIEHPNYDDWTFDYDLSLLRLSGSVDYASYPHIGPVCLPVEGQGYQIGEQFLVTGRHRPKHLSGLTPIQEATVAREEEILDIKLPKYTKHNNLNLLFVA